MKLGVCDRLRVGVAFSNRKSLVLATDVRSPRNALSKLFYMIYRNMYLADRSLACAPHGVRCANIEYAVVRAFDVICADPHAYLLRPVLDLLKISDFAKTTKPRLMDMRHLTDRTDK